MLRKKENYTVEDFNEALNNFKENAKYLNFWDVENELLEYNKLNDNEKYLHDLNPDKRNRMERFYDLEKVIKELYKIY